MFAWVLFGLSVSCLCLLCVCSVCDDTKGQGAAGLCHSVSCFCPVFTTSFIWPYPLHYQCTAITAMHLCGCPRPCTALLTPLILSIVKQWHCSSDITFFCLLTIHRLWSQSTLRLSRQSFLALSRYNCFKSLLCHNESPVFSGPFFKPSSFVLCQPGAWDSNLTWRGWILIFLKEWFQHWTKSKHPFFLDFLITLPESMDLLPVMHGV